jgi:cytochrome c oxidase subunit 2
MLKHRFGRRFASIVASLLAAPAALADWELNMPRGVTQITNEVYDLHMLIFWICVVIGIGVFGVMFYSIVFHTKKKNPNPAKFSHSTAAEVIWTAIPIVILVAMAFPAAKTLVAIEDAGNPDMTVKVTGYQWKWHYEYLEEDVEFFSSLASDSNMARQLGSGVDPASVDNYLLDVDNPLVVPVNTKVRILLTANDVIHAWWVPELSGKRDAIPGFVNQLWFSADKTGTYRGQCAELCGYDHGFMPIVVIVKEEADYLAWLGEQGVEDPSRFARKNLNQDTEAVAVEAAAR